MTILTRKQSYPGLYTWSHLIGDEVVAHQDGAVSVLIDWDGIDAELLTDLERRQAWSSVVTALGVIPQGYCAEFHLWREWDDSLAQAYLAKQEAIVRGGELSRALREAHAAHLAQYGMRNEVAVVLTRVPPSPLPWGATRALVRQARDAQDLLERARLLASKLPGGRVAGADRYLGRIQQSYDRARFARGHGVRVEPQFLLAEQLVPVAPEEREGGVTLGDQTSKVLLVFLYPDAEPGWFVGLAALGLPMHVVQVVLPVDTKAAMRASERSSDLAEGTLGRRGQDTQWQTVKDLAGFRQFVAEQNLSIFQNVFVVHLHGEPTQLRRSTEIVTDWIERQGGQVRDQAYVQLPYWRAAQPGQGYRAPMFRPDHTWQIAAMCPAQVYRLGDPNPESLRLGESGQLIGFSLLNQPVAHSFTVAITGGGKGVDKVATIAETYPLGIDWYLAEIGGSYRWVVEGFGGTYTKIDPGETVVNPLPPYAVAVNDPARPDTYPLNPVLAGGTVNALAFLLTDGHTTLDIHQTAAAQGALQVLYADPAPERAVPTLVDYLQELERVDDIEQPEQREAARRMAANLASFLDTAEGRIFAREDNLLLSEGITGVDLKEVDRASPKLLKFYLVFLALRFNHLAFARRNPARVLLDELHKFVAIAPEVIGRLISELARMGRKDGAAIDLVTQGIAEIDVIETEVINSMPLRSLLYRGDEWEAIAKRINMPPGPLAVWTKFPYPLTLDWRPALRSVGPEYYHLHLTFPSLLLDLAATSPEDLDLKEAIGKTVTDPLDRLRVFRARKEGRG